MSGPVRVYLPATLTSLTGVLAGGPLVAGTAFAVTPRLRASLALPSHDGDDMDDELAEAALVAAADASIDLIGEDPAAPRRRVVVVVDTVVDVAGVADRGPDDHPAAIRPPTGLALADVVCLMVDDVATVPAVEAVLDVREGTVEQYEAALDDLDEHALSWFDASELPHLVEHAPRTKQEGAPRGS